MNCRNRCISLILFILILSVCMPGLSTAQKFGAGVKVGMVNADFHGEDEEVQWWSSKTGVSAGGFIYGRFFKIFEIQPEFLYVQKGAKTVSFWYDFYYYTVHLDYIEMPVLFKFIAPLKSPFSPYIYGGPYYAMLINDKGTVRSSSGIEEYPLENIKEHEYGYVIGGGGEIHLGFWKILGEMRFSCSVISFIEPEEEEIDMKNRAFSFIIGFAF
jgi:hypothetical protein